MTKPDIGFFVVGAARSGTTSLYAALGMHPDVFCPEFKEPRFFRGNDDKDWDWYASLFADAREGQILGDFSPNYMDFERENPVAAKIHEHYPDARIVYIVRNPISCAISNWQMGCEVFNEVIPFEEAYLGRMKGSVLLRSRFGLQYRLLKRVIPKKQILVLPLEGLSTTPGPYLRALQRHLGVERHPIKYRHRNATKWKPGRPPAPVLTLDERKRFIARVKPDANEILSVMGLEPDFWDVSETSAAWQQPLPGEAPATA